MRSIFKLLVGGVVGFFLGTLFIMVPYNKSHEPFCFKDDEVGVVKVSHLDGLYFLVLATGFSASTAGALADIKLEKTNELVACPAE